MYELRDIRWIIARAAVVDTIVAVANAIDAEDWQKLRSHLADEIDIDYSEFLGIKQTVVIFSGNTQVHGALLDTSQSNLIHKSNAIRFFITQSFLLPGSENCTRISNPFVIELFPNPHKNLRD